MGHAVRYSQVTPDADELIEKLSAFIGCWKGQGQGAYPTIEPFEYEETLTFEMDSARSLLHYEQRTSLITPNRPSHWESGFLRPLDSGLIQLSNSQNSGRVEVLQGPLRLEGEVTELELESILLDNDPRMVQTNRIFELRGDTLSYGVGMATRTTESPKLQFHLSASLTKVS